MYPLLNHSHRGSPVPHNTFEPPNPTFPGFLLLTEAISEVSNVPKLKERSPRCFWSSSDRKAKIEFRACKFSLNKQPPLGLLTVGFPIIGGSAEKWNGRFITDPIFAQGLQPFNLCALRAAGHFPVAFLDPGGIWASLTRDWINPYIKWSRERGLCLLSGPNSKWNCSLRKQKGWKTHREKKRFQSILQCL